MYEHSILREILKRLRQGILLADNGCQRYPDKARPVDQCVAVMIVHIHAVRIVGHQQHVVDGELRMSERVVCPALLTIPRNGRLKNHLAVCPRAEGCL